MTDLIIVLKEFPILYQKTSRGSTKQWQISVVELADTVFLKAEFGLIGGKLQQALKEIVGKNLGKKNETSPEQQAISVALSMCKKKFDEGYVENVENMQEGVRVPMLAKEYLKNRHNVVFPCYTQPKIEGVRCTSPKEKEVTYLSRTNKKFNSLAYWKPYHSRILNSGEEFDGEIYNPDYTFQELCSYIKNPVKLAEDKAKLFHYVYDMPMEEVPFEERYAELEKRIALLDSLVPTHPLELVQCDVANSHEEIMQNHEKYVTDGWEGTIIRNRLGLYKFNYRSSDLLKHKDFIDEEFEIIDVIEGEGRDRGTGIFICRTKVGKLFKARPKGSIELRKWYLLHRLELIGKMLTVRFQRWTDAGIPYLPIGITIRDYE